MLKVACLVDFFFSVSASGNGGNPLGKIFSQGGFFYTFPFLSKSYLSTAGFPMLSRVFARFARSDERQATPAALDNLRPPCLLQKSRKEREKKFNATQLPPPEPKIQCLVTSGAIFQNQNNASAINNDWCQWNPRRECLDPDKQDQATLCSVP